MNVALVLEALLILFVIFFGGHNNGSCLNLLIIGQILLKWVNFYHLNIKHLIADNSLQQQIL